jgi:hypothetical protein
MPKRKTKETEAQKDSRLAREVDGMKKKIPEELDRIADVVLAYRPKPKSKAAKKRTRKAKRDTAKNN